MSSTTAHDHNRVTPQGRELGANLARMTDPEVAALIASGEWDHDERCVSCAFRAGTIPNGCAQTQLDALKCVLEKQTFGCHVARDGLPAGAHACMGWFAAMQARGGPIARPAIACPWPFSPPDPDDEPTTPQPPDSPGD